MGGYMTTVGIYGGSFDPIHEGHSMVARKLLDSGVVDEILFVPAAISPHKREAAPASGDDRLKMIQLALAGIENVTVSDIEIQRGGTSYTVDTITILSEEEAKSESPRALRLIIGGDAAKTFHTWKDPETIAALAPPIVVRRGNGKLVIPDSPVHDILVEGTTDIVATDISSTEVRRRLRAGERCDDLVDDDVLEYIYNNNLYIER